MIPPGPSFARVVVNLALDRAFDYRVPERLRRLVHIGSRVTVPFGNGWQQGFVVALPEHAEVEGLKDLETVHGERPMIPPKLLDLGEWMGRYYCCSREQAIRALLPAVVRQGRIATKTRRVFRLNPAADTAKELESCARKAPKRADALKLINRCPGCSHEFLVREAHLSPSALAYLVEKGFVLVEEEAEARDPFAGQVILPTQPHPLMPEQSQALAMVRESFAKPRKDVILLHGVTGSGKTEIYLQAIADCLTRGEEAIVLVPEIALTPQTTEGFRSRFGELVSVLHSHLSDGERFDEWTRIHDGRVKIAVGARSALFAPFQHLGLIVVDEEHETSYKQTDMPPRYHARDVAVMRGHFENVTVVLATATPALESYYNVQRGKYRLAVLSKRVDEQVMPTMEVVDMVAEAESGGRAHIFSRHLISAITSALENSEQVVLFLNRRGYATHLQCLKCGYVAACDDCSINFTYHKQRAQLICHLCGAMRHAPTTCPQCQDPGIRFGGMGTERIETITHTLFPQARVLRMDSDTMTRKDAYREALTAFRAGTFDILVGTQMIAKGLHFPNVTLVGIIFADLTLNLPDFRAGERTFQLLVQVAGRAGRGEVPGRVIVQTYTPYHVAVQSALHLDCAGFYEQEIAARAAANLPPLSHMAMVHFRGPVEAAVQAATAEFAQQLRPRLAAITTLGPPTPGVVPKKRGLFYYHLLLHGGPMMAVSRTLKDVMTAFRPPKDVRVSVDIDPYSLM